MQWILFLSAIGLASARVLQKPSELLRTLHTLMNVDELSRTFGVDNSSQVEAYEVVYIHRHRIFVPEDPLQRNDDHKTTRSDPHENHAHYSFAANGRNYDLKLRPNYILMAPKMKTVVRGSGGHGKEIVEGHPRGDDCHFLNIDVGLVAALSHCTDDDIRGYVIDGGKSLEILPIPMRLRQMLRSSAENDKDNSMVGAHIVRSVDQRSRLRAHQSDLEKLRFQMKPNVPQDDTIPVYVSSKNGIGEKSRSNLERGNSGKYNMERTASNKIIELGIFVDQAAMGLFMPYFGANEYVKLRELILAFVNAMQALYHLPSLGQQVDLSIVYMEFHAKAPATLIISGDRGKLLDSFCAFQTKLNKPSDSDAEHWDMALLLSGLDFYAVEGGKNNYVTMGLSTVTGVCTDIYNCVIGEFGVTNQQGQPYPSTGFTSVYVMAHEIGHNLGMSHDSSGNTCTTEGFIMSPSRGVVGEATWSTCSAASLAKITETCMNDLPTANYPDYNHEKYGDKPGQLWSADEQCRILLRDKAAVAYFATNADVAASCNSLKCKTPNRDGFFTSGPALSGTVCGSSLWCVGGSCVPTSRVTILENDLTDWENITGPDYLDNSKVETSENGDTGLEDDDFIIIKLLK